MIIRPQRKQAQKKQEMLESMKPGDAVVTVGGLHGVIDEVSTSSRTVVLDCEGVYLTFAMHAIATVTQGGNVEARREEIAEANYEAEAESEADTSEVVFEEEEE